MQPIQRLHAKIVVLRSDLVATCRAFALVRYKREERKEGVEELHCACW
jgi:hypothetical protein